MGTTQPTLTWLYFFFFRATALMAARASLAVRFACLKALRAFLNSVLAVSNSARDLSSSLGACGCVGAGASIFAGRLGAVFFFELIVIKGYICVTEWSQLSKSANVTICATSRREVSDGVSLSIRPSPLCALAFKPQEDSGSPGLDPRRIFPRLIAAAAAILDDVSDGSIQRGFTTDFTDERR